MRDFTAGINWVLYSNFRTMLNYVVSDSKGRLTKIGRSGFNSTSRHEPPEVGLGCWSPESMIGSEHLDDFREHVERVLGASGT